MTTPAAPQPSSFGPPNPSYGAPAGMQAPAHPGATAWQPGAPICRNCGAQPAVAVTVRAHQGLLIVMRFHKLDGPFCKACGTAVVRQLTTNTLGLGWWSPLSLVIFTPFTLIWNLVVSHKLAALPQPGPALPGASRLQEGKPVLRRPMAYLAIAPLIWAGWVIYNIITHA
ncbi:hypothetical protein OIU91_41265 (plasmid) [Streptomyces sp. NBC_01456]|uniref:hypothetical protein n=1 Tax=unclassified Streptomyces TaxID=2593676 RepID=UPI002E333BEC|nr:MULTISPECIES: hypothetical protein [unclassified Streptomyces]